MSAYVDETKVVQGTSSFISALHEELFYTVPLVDQKKRATFQLGSATIPFLTDDVIQSMVSCIKIHPKHLTTRFRFGFVSIEWQTFPLNLQDHTNESMEEAKINQELLNAILLYTSDAMVQDSSSMSMDQFITWEEKHSSSSLFVTNWIRSFEHEIIQVSELLKRYVSSKTSNDYCDFVKAFKQLGHNKLYHVLASIPFIPAVFCNAGIAFDTQELNSMSTVQRTNALFSADYNLDGLFGSLESKLLRSMSILFQYFKHVACGIEEHLLSYHLNVDVHSYLERNVDPFFTMFITLVKVTQRTYIDVLYGFQSEPPEQLSKLIYYLAIILMDEIVSLLFYEKQPLCLDEMILVNLLKHSFQLYTLFLQRKPSDKDFTHISEVSFSSSSSHSFASYLQAKKKESQLCIQRRFTKLRNYFIELHPIEKVIDHLFQEDTTEEIIDPLYACCLVFPMPDKMNDLPFYFVHLGCLVHQVFRTKQRTLLVNYSRPHSPHMPECVRLAELSCFSPTVVTSESLMMFLHYQLGQTILHPCSMFPFLRTLMITSLRLSKVYDDVTEGSQWRRDNQSRCYSMIWTLSVLCQEYSKNNSEINVSEPFLYPFVYQLRQSKGVHPPLFQQGCRLFVIRFIRCLVTLFQQHYSEKLQGSMDISVGIYEVLSRVFSEPFCLFVPSSLQFDLISTLHHQSLVPPSDRLRQEYRPFVLIHLTGDRLEEWFLLIRRLLKKLFLHTVLSFPMLLSTLGLKEKHLQEMNHCLSYLCVKRPFKTCLFVEYGSCSNVLSHVICSKKLCGSFYVCSHHISSTSSSSSSSSSSSLCPSCKQDTVQLIQAEQPVCILQRPTTQEKEKATPIEDEKRHKKQKEEKEEGNEKKRKEEEEEEEEKEKKRKEEKKRKKEKKRKEKEERKIKKEKKRNNNKEETERRKKKEKNQDQDKEKEKEQQEMTIEKDRIATTVTDIQIPGFSPLALKIIEDDKCCDEEHDDTLEWLDQSRQQYSFDSSQPLSEIDKLKETIQVQAFQIEAMSRTLQDQQKQIDWMLFQFSFRNVPVSKST